MTGADRRKYDPERLEEALAEVASLAKAEGVRVALCGGLAMQLYGSERLTKDVDVLAADRVRGLPRGTALSFGGEQTRASNGVPVDIIVRRDDYAPLYEDALSYAVRVPGSPLPVARPEYMAAMKLSAGRRKDEQDLDFLILHKVDVAKARKVIKHHLGFHVANEWDNRVQQVRWLDSRGKV